MMKLKIKGWLVLAVALCMGCGVTGRVQAQEQAPPTDPRRWEGLVHLEWLALPQRQVSRLLRDPRYQGWNAGALHEEVNRLIKSGVGRIAARDSTRVVVGDWAFQAGTEVQVPQSYVGPRMAKDITVNRADETTDPVEPALVHSTQPVFMGRRVSFRNASEGGGFIFLDIDVTWTVPQGRVVWGEGKAAKTFHLWRETMVHLNPPLLSKSWSLAAVVPSPVGSPEVDQPGGALNAPVPDEKLMLFLRPDLAMDPAKARRQARAMDSPGCLVEWIELDDAKAVELLERHPSGSDPALRSEVERMEQAGEAVLKETAWVAAKAEINSETHLAVPYEYEMVTPWQIHRTAGALPPLGPLRNPWWLPPQADRFEREKFGLSVGLGSHTYLTTGGSRVGIELNFSRRQLTGMKKIGRPGMEISFPLWSGILVGREELKVSLIPGRSTLIHTHEAAHSPSAAVFAELPPPTGRKCLIFVTAAVPKE